MMIRLHPSSAKRFQLVLAKSQRTLVTTRDLCTLGRGEIFFQSKPLTKLPGYEGGIITFWKKSANRFAITSSPLLPIGRSYSTSSLVSQAEAPKTQNKGPSNSTVPRTAISVLGAVNAGKSILMNLLLQSDVSIVHDTAGTTTDPKICLMELHGRIGPVRLLDTPGIDESGDLGLLKREKALQTIGQCDVAVIVADPFAPEHTLSCVPELLMEVEKRQEMNRQADLGAGVKGDKSIGGGSRPSPVALLVFNLREDKVNELESNGGSISLLLEDIEKKILEKLEEGKAGGEDRKTTLPPTLAVDFTSIKASRDRIIGFLERHSDPRPNSVEVLPASVVDTHADGYSPTVFLNIPIDQQSPSMRLLRPQAMIQEALIRHYVSTYAYRMDLALARFGSPVEIQREKDRFLHSLDPLLASGDLKLLITDSQAIDVVAPWTLDSDGNEIVPITTFSIAMIRYLSGGRLGYFADGLRKLDQMMTGEISPRSDSQKWRVLVTEACNHTRLNLEKQCADIGTVQLPAHLQKVLGEDNVEFDYAFGKHVMFDPSRFDLVVHCGGCMLNPQQMDSRVADLMAAGVPATNYGLLLARIQSPATLSRVLKPWDIDYDHNDHQHFDNHDTDNVAYI